MKVRDLLPYLYVCDSVEIIGGETYRFEPPLSLPTVILDAPLSMISHSSIHDTMEIYLMDSDFFLSLKGGK